MSDLMARFKRWLWLHLTLVGRYELTAASRYQAMLDRTRNSSAFAAHREKVRACKPHPNRATIHPSALDPERYKSERCLDCGTHIVTWVR